MNISKNEQLVSAAKKICTSGCIACFECGKSKSNFGFISRYGNNEVCPLAKYDIEHGEKRESFLESLLNNPDLDDLFLLCKHCDHRDKSSDKGDDISLSNCFETHCMDCPVQMCRENIQECMAEAALS